MICQIIVLFVFFLLFFFSLYHLGPSVSQLLLYIELCPPPTRHLFCFVLAQYAISTEEAPGVVMQRTVGHGGSLEVGRGVGRGGCRGSDIIVVELSLRTGE